MLPSSDQCTGALGQPPISNVQIFLHLTSKLIKTVHKQFKTNGPFHTSIDFYYKYFEVIWGFKTWIYNDNINEIYEHKSLPSYLRWKDLKKNIIIKISSLYGKLERVNI